jgi:hypothetical protein
MLPVPSRGRPRRLLARAAAIAVALAATCATVAPARLDAQGVPAPAPVAAPADTGSMVGAIRAFLDCRGDTSLGCANDYFITELPWVTWTRDRLFADVQFLVTTIQNGSGGFEYTIAAIGRGRFDGRVDTSVVRALPAEAEATIRTKLSRAMALLLVPYVRGTPQASGIAVTWTPPAGRGGRQLSPASVRDPWNFWTIELSANGSTDGEVRQQRGNLFTDVRARRVTEKWSARAGVFNFLRTGRFEVNDSTVVRNLVRNGAAFARVVRALDSRLSVGLLGNLGYDEFRNIDMVARLAPVIEYNVFPWSQATRRQVAISYGIGPRHFRFIDTTIFGRKSEWRAQQELVVGSDVRQPWGNIRGSLRYASFVPAFDLWNLGANGDVTINIVKGLSFNIGGGASYIRDQNFLAARGQTRDEILLQQRALATNYSYFVYGGISYTFGSIYNSVVNPRLDFFNLGGN